MAKGVVKWFSNAKGYGFIEQEEGVEGDSEEVFAHFSAVTMEGYKTLKKGQKVEYEIETGPKGLLASEIRLAS